MPSRLIAGDYEAEFAALEAEREAMAEFVGTVTEAVKAQRATSPPVSSPRVPSATASSLAPAYPASSLASRPCPVADQAAYRKMPPACSC
jgi:hypothetical protein